MLCPICNSKHIKENVDEDWCRFLRVKLFRHRCEECGLIFGPRRMFEITDQQIGEMYRLLYSGYKESDDPRIEISAFEALEPISSGSYLNFGAGRAPSQQILTERGYNILPYDPMLKINTDDLGVYDGVFSANLLEHLTKPVETLTYMRSLSPNQAHFTPCFADDLKCKRKVMEYAYTSFHVLFFSLISLQTLAELAGFNTCEIQPHESGAVIRLKT